MPAKLFYIILILNIPAHALAQPLLEWKSIDSFNSKMPVGIEIFKATGSIEGDTLTAYYSITDISRGDLVLYPLYSEYNQKPEKYFSESPEDIVIITNGGYFGTNVSYSLVLNNYKTLVPNIRAVNRSHNNTNYLYYPTRSAFGVDPNLKAEAAYVYTFSDNNQTYSYPEPSPNTTENLPLPQPTPEYPEGGEIWKVSEAIGGGPLLIKDSIINTNYSPELFPNDITGSIAPRTAIGIRGDGKLINLVVDGRQDHSKGISLHSLSEILLELGCVDAINLDGGGSSVLTVYDEVINKPSDGNPRYIPSVVSIKKALMLRNNDPAYFNPVQQASDSLKNIRFPETKTLIFGKGETGVYSFKDILPAEYRLEFYNNSESEYNYSDSIEFIFSLGSERKDTIYLNQGSLTGNQFVNLGSRQLGPHDTFKISNKSEDGYLHLDVLRLIKTGSGLPEIDLDPRVYYGNYSTGDSIKFKIEAFARNRSRKITAFKVYEIIQDNYVKLSQRSFAPVESYEDSVHYIIQKDPDQIRLKSVVYDELNDSSSVFYTLNIDNTPPTVAFGKNSVLQGERGDTLIFELKLLPGNESRPLEILEIFKDPANENKLLTTIKPSPQGDTIKFHYEIKEEDLTGVEFRFIIHDESGYSASRDFSYFYNSIFDIKNHNLSFQYNPKLKQLEINSRISQAREKLHAGFYDLSGRLLYQKNIIHSMHSTLDLDFIPPGITLVKIVYGSKIYNYRFIQPY